MHGPQNVIYYNIHQMMYYI